MLTNNESRISITPVKFSRKNSASLLHFGSPKRITYGQKLKMTPNEFDIFIATLHDRMYRFARTLLGVQVEAEDAVADVEERLWRRHEALEHHRGAHSMAMTAVRNACLDRLRRQREELVERLPETAADDSRSDVRDAVRKAIAQLPDRQREVIHLREIEGYNCREIGEMLSLDEANVRMILSRGRRQLKEIIEKTTDYGELYRTH